MESDNPTSRTQKIKGAILWFFGLLVPLFQFVPNTWMFWGAMSMPLAGVVLISLLMLLFRGAILGGGFLHPQYLGLILLTGGLTVGVLRMNPVWVWGEGGESIAGIWIAVAWLLEVSAYLVLAKIEDLHLKSRYGEAYEKYAGRVPFMVP